MKKTKINSLYIHIPFCRHLCDYCDFTKMFYLSKYVSKYVNHLCEEIDALKDKKYQTIYVGGGTPSSLTPRLLKKLLSSLSKHLYKKYEFTLEVNPETLNKEKIRIMKEYGVNRISMGVQSFNEKILQQLNRKHSANQVKYWISQFKRFGIDNINVDLIYGLPNQTWLDLKNDLEQFMALRIDHISTYSLTVSKGTVFYNKHIKEIDSDLSRQFYDYIFTKLTQNGFERYEVSNFARNKKYSQHNINYWKALEYKGLGLGACGFEDGIRYQNTANIKEYLKGHHILFKELLTKKELLEDYLMLNLRLNKGFRIDDFTKKFGSIEKYDFYFLINEFVERKLLIKTKNRIYCSYDGLMILDYILVNLFIQI